MTVSVLAYAGQPAERPSGQRKMRALQPTGPRHRPGDDQGNPTALARPGNGTYTVPVTTMRPGPARYIGGKVRSVAYGLEVQPA